MSAVRVGLISDTHGMLRAEAIAFLRGSEFIIHAGDIGAREVLQTLSAIAPVTAVRGNNDRDRWAADIPETAVLAVGAMRIYVLHDLAGLAMEPSASDIQVVVSGHSHKPRSEQRDGVLYINPGSAGPRRFRLPISIAELQVSGRSVKPRVVELQDPSARANRR